MKRTRSGTASHSVTIPPLVRGCILLAALAVVSWLVGCVTTSPTPPVNNQPAPPDTVSTEIRLRTGDPLQVHLTTGGPSTDKNTQQLEVVVDENGEISLPLVGRIAAVSLTPSELSERIEASYVPRFYVRCHAIVLATTRYFYVGGEVRNPGRFPWTEDVTILKAINTAQSFTDYANRRKVEITRGKQKLVVDSEEARSSPAKDIAILPGDSIWVPRSIF